MKTREAYPDFLDKAWRQMKTGRKKTAPTVVSTFAGAGGSSMGYLMAGYREVFAADWDKHSCECLRLNFPKLPIFEGDIAELTVDHICETTGLEPGQLDVLDGSPPCQGFSTIGRRAVDDDRNELFRHYVRLLEGLSPRAFVMENVGGMVKGDMRLLFAEILDSLTGVGYTVKAWVLNSMWFGVPQARERVIFIGSRDDIDVEPSPPPPVVELPYSMMEACGFELMVKTHFKRDVRNGSRPAFVIPASSPACYLVTPHNGMPSGVLTTGDQAGCGVRLDKPSPTVAASGFGKVWKQGFCVEAEPVAGNDDPTSDDYSPSLRIPGPPPSRSSVARAMNGSVKRPRLFANEIDAEKMRTLSIGEVMRLQSFPDRYAWPEKTSWSKGWTRVGNSVPPLMMRAVARQVRSSILR